MINASARPGMININPWPGIINASASQGKQVFLYASSVAKSKPRQTSLPLCLVCRQTSLPLCLVCRQIQAKANKSSFMPRLSPNPSRRRQITIASDGRLLHLLTFTIIHICITVGVMHACLRIAVARAHLLPSGLMFRTSASWRYRGSGRTLQRNAMSTPDTPRPII